MYTDTMKTYRHDIDTRSGEEPRIPPERSIRHIEPSEARVRMARPNPVRPPVSDTGTSRKRPGRVWITALISLFVLGSLVAMLFIPETKVTIVPHTQTVPFDASTSFTAFPAGTTTGLTYSLIEETFEETVVVPASGVEFSEELAKGTITVFNAYSEDSIRLIKNTRFESPDGKIFRIQNSIEVPGKIGVTPGSIQAEIFADQAGSDYNVGPYAKMTLPGLKGTPDMFAGVYATSQDKFTGGFSGERPSVPRASLEAARTEVRARLGEKVRAIEAPEGATLFTDLAKLSYEDLLPQKESGGVRVGERVRVRIPVFKSALFAKAVGEAVSASAENNDITIFFSDSASASLTSNSTFESYGVESISFSLSGVAQLVWQIDSLGLATALAAKDESAFQAIVGAYPSVEEAHALLVPFWRSTFPSNPSDITVLVENPPKPF